MRGIHPQDMVTRIQQRAEKLERLTTEFNKCEGRILVIQQKHIDLDAAMGKEKLRLDHFVIQLEKLKSTRITEV